MYNDLQVKRNKEFIATNIQEIFNPFQIAQISQPIDLQKLFMHQLSQQPPMISPQQNITNIQELAMQATAITNNNNNPTLLNGVTSTMVTNTNINVTYFNGVIGTNKYDEKFKMHQGFIAVLKVSCFTLLSFL